MAYRATTLLTILALGLVVLPVSFGASEQDREAEAEKPAKPVDSPYVRAMKQQKKQQNEAQAARQKDEVKVYTNDDLERMFAGAGDSGPKPAAEAEAEGKPAGDAPSAKPDPTAEKPKDVDPLDWMAERNAAQAKKTEQIAEAEARVTAAEERVRSLERRIRAVSNPFLARPEVAEDEAEEWNGLDNQQRIEKSREQLETAREELAAARAELSRLRR